jgi:ATP-dependent DNA ligase
VKSPLPGFIEPALATSIDRVPGGERWIHEIKFDGYRVPVHLANEAVKVYTRRGHDWTRRFKKRRRKRLAHQVELGDHRRRDRSAGRRWHHRLLRVAE